MSWYNMTWKRKGAQQTVITFRLGSHKLSVLPSLPLTFTPQLLLPPKTYQGLIIQESRVSTLALSNV